MKGSYWHEALATLPGSMPTYGEGEKRRSMRRIKAELERRGFDDEWIEAVDDSFCRGFGTAVDVMRSVMLEAAESADSAERSIPTMTLSEIEWDGESGVPPEAVIVTPEADVFTNAVLERDVEGDLLDVGNEDRGLTFSRRVPGGVVMIDGPTGDEIRFGYADLSDWFIMKSVNAWMARNGRPKTRRFTVTFAGKARP